MNLMFAFSYSTSTVIVLVSVLELSPEITKFSEPVNLKVILFQIDPVSVLLTQNGKGFLSIQIYFLIERTITRFEIILLIYFEKKTLIFLYFSQLSLDLLLVARTFPWSQILSTGSVAVQHSCSGNPLRSPSHTRLDFHLLYPYSLKSVPSFKYLTHTKHFLPPYFLSPFGNTRHFLTTFSFLASSNIINV